ncbi:MAG: hypothetical protein WDA11_14090 [Thiohalomonadaceae bacterium]
MKRTHFFAYMLLIVSFIICITSGCNLSENTIGLPEGNETDRLTLLERMYDDTDQDGEKESIELYTSAEIAPDGEMGWDTGHRWVLIVRKGDQIFPLFDNWVQHGEVQFWIAYFNNNNVEGSESTDLNSQIFVAVTESVAFKILSYNWEIKSMCYIEEIVLNPPDQWAIRHSNKYNIPDPAKIESSSAFRTEADDNK